MLDATAREVIEVFRPTWGWIASTAVCAGLVALVGVLLGAGWPTIVVMSAGMAIACVSSLVIYNRRKAAGRD